MKGPHTFLITGLPFVGKTTVLLRSLEHIDFPTIGFCTHAIWNGNVKSGLKLVNHLGMERRVATLSSSTSTKVGKYSVDIFSLDAFVQETFVELRSTLLVYVDEIGRVLLSSPVFKKNLRRMIGRNTILATTSSARIPHALGAATVVHRATSTNRDQLPFVIAEAVAQELESARSA